MSVSARENLFNCPPEVNPSPNALSYFNSFATWRADAHELKIGIICMKLII